MKNFRQRYKSYPKSVRRQIVLTIIFIAFIVFLLVSPTKNILRTDVANTFAGPSAAHWFGTDNLGRDVYSLLIRGGLRTIEVVLIATAISFFAGTTLGLIAAFSDNALEAVVQFVADFTLVIPSFILAMVFSALFGFSPVMAGIVFGLGNMGDYINQSYQLAYSLRQQEFIDAEIVVGVDKARVLIRHVLPNVIRPLLVFLGNKAGNVVVQYSGLAFIGLGTDITNPDWGTLLYSYRSYIITHPMLVILPAAAISILTIFFHLMFDSGDNHEVVTIYD